jgi:undecaprenyl-diphosphatase
MRQRLLSAVLIAWSLTNCWTRLYLGVHYPGDILVGLVWGGCVGYGVYRLYCRFARPACYSVTLCDIPVVVLSLTLVAALGYSLMQVFFP